jgi:hypothetical protein
MTIKSRDCHILERLNSIFQDMYTPPTDCKVVWHAFFHIFNSSNTPTFSCSCETEVGNDDQPCLEVSDETDATSTAPRI